MQREQSPSISFDTTCFHEMNCSALVLSLRSFGCLLMALSALIAVVYYTKLGASSSSGSRTSFDQRTHFVRALDSKLGNSAAPYG